MLENVRSVVSETKQKTEEFVNSMDGGLKGPVAVMGLGMMAGQMLGELGAKGGLDEAQLNELISIFCSAFRLTTQKHYKAGLTDG